MPKIIVSDAQGEREVLLDKDEILLGRVAGQCDVVIKVPEASRRHCRLLREDDVWFVEDLGSSNGTRVNGRKVTKFELQDGDEIQVGVARVRFLTSDLMGPASDEIELEDVGDLEISLDDEEAWLRFDNGPRQGEKVALQGRLTVGRRSTNDLVLTEKGISGSHAEFFARDGKWWVRDMGSTNGTLVNGAKVVEAELTGGDSVKIGVVEFSFGTGEFDEAESLQATVTLDTGEMGESVFAISDANLRKKRKTSLLLTFAVLILVVGCGAYWIMQGSKKKAGRKEVKAMAGNLVAQGASFELDRLGDADYLVSDAADLDYEEVRTKAHSGRYALKLQARGGRGRELIAFAAPVQSVVSGDRFDVGAWIQVSGLDGFAGIGLRWLDEDGKSLGEDLVLAPPGGSGFVEVHGLLRPPAGATSALVVLGTVDATGKAYMDDVYVLRRRGDSAHNLAFNGYTAFLDANGRFSLERDGRDLVTRGGPVQWDGGHVVDPAGAFLADQRTYEADSIRVEGDHGGGGHLTVKLGPGKKGLVLDASVEEGEGEWFMGLAVAPEQGLVTVASDRAEWHGEDFARDGVTELIIGKGHRSARIVFETPVPVRMVTERRATWLLIPFGREEGQLACSLPIQLDFKDEIARAGLLAEQAARAHRVEKNYGLAMKLYSEIVNRYAFRQDLAESAQASYEELRSSGERRSDELARRIDDVIFFKTFRRDAEALQQEGRRLQSAYAGTAIAEQVGKQLERLTGAWNALRRAERESMARVQLARGKDLMRPGKSMPLLAQAFFVSARRLAPEGSEIRGEAEAELERIRRLLAGD